MITPEERAKQIDLGDGSLCCDRAAGGICYEHQAIAEKIKEALWEGIKEKYAQVVDGWVTICIGEHRSILDSHIRRYRDEYMAIDTGWGFWDEAGLYFHAGYKTDGEAHEAMKRYAEAL